MLVAGSGTGYDVCKDLEIEYVGADLKVMERDSKRMRGDKPFIFTNVRNDEGVEDVMNWIKRSVLLEDIK